MRKKSVRINNEQQQQNLVISGKINAQIVECVAMQIVPGMSTMDVEILVQQELAKNKVRSAFLGYSGYKFNSCISINNCIIHGIPSEKKFISAGDLLKLDLGVIYNDMVTDHCRSYIIDNNISKYPKQNKILQISLEGLNASLNTIRSGVDIRVSSKAMQSYVESHGFFINYEYCSHGVGLELHEYPDILNFYHRDIPKEYFYEGQSVAIECMTSELPGFTEIDKLDGFSVNIKGGGLSAVFEHTGIVRKDFIEILTKLD